MEIFVVCRDRPSDATPMWKSVIAGSIECAVIEHNDRTRWMAGEIGLEGGFCLAITCPSEDSQQGQNAAMAAATLLRGAVWNEYDGEEINPFYNHSGAPHGQGEDATTLENLRRQWAEVESAIEAERIARAEAEERLKEAQGDASSGSDWDWD